MADISKVKLPSGNVYDIKDAVAREMIAGGVSFNVGWDGTSVPDVTKIPAGVQVTYNGTTYTGTLSPESAQPGAFYLVKTSDENLNIYSEYVAAGATGSKFWEKLGDTAVDLSDLGALAYKDNVTISKGSGDNVLGEATNFTAASSAVSFSNGASDTFVKSYPGATSKLVTTTVPNVTGNEDVSIPNVTDSADVSIPNVTGNTNVSIPNVTNAGSASTWSFAMGMGTDAETLIISGGNGSAPTLGTALSASKVTLGTALSASKVTLGTNLTASKVTLGSAKTVATGALASNGGGGTVMTGLGTATTASAVTSIGTATAAAQTITVGTNDKVKVAKYDDLGVNVS